MEEFISLLDENLICTSMDISADFIRFSVTSTRKECVCPSCLQVSSRIHSRYSRSFQDLPIQDKKVIITLSNRKMFCDNRELNHVINHKRVAQLMKEMNLVCRI